MGRVVWWIITGLGILELEEEKERTGLEGKSIGRRLIGYHNEYSTSYIYICASDGIMIS